MDLLILNQYFPPDRAATAILLGQLEAELRSPFHTTVVCGTPTYNPSAANASTEAPRIHRIRLFSVSRARMVFRLLNYFIFSIGALLRALLLPRHRVIMCWTDPPWISAIGGIVARIKGSTLILVHQDIYPEILLATGKLRRGRLFAFFQSISARMLRRANHHVVIGREMIPVLAAKKVPIDRITVIENWQDIAALRPADKRIFRGRHAIPQETFVVMHSGNMGFSQNLDLLLDAATHLREASIQFVLIGDGARKNHLRQKAQTSSLSNVLFLPYQDEAILPESLSAADVHYVSLLDAYMGVLVPSKIYGIMSAGKPTVAVLPEGCTTKQVIENSMSGVCAGPDAAALAKVILDLSKNKLFVEQMGQNARNHAERTGGKQNAAKTYADLIERVANTPR